MLLRFSIRDLLWLTAVVSLAVGWWVSNQTLRQRLDDLARQRQQPTFDTKGHAINPQLR